MCDWVTLTLATGLSFCTSGRFENGCTPDPTNGIYMGIAHNLQVRLVPGDEYLLLTDARCPGEPSQFTLHGGLFTNTTSSDLLFDPWTASSFASVSTFVATQEDVVVTMPPAPRHDRERAVVCPTRWEGTAQPAWRSLLSLPAERTKTKIFSHTLVYPTLPLPIGALVLAYLKKKLDFRLVLVILFYTDGIWWIANTISSSELSGAPSTIYIPILLSLSAFALSFLFWKSRIHQNLVALCAIGVASLVTSPFYYTPLALLLSPIWLDVESKAEKNMPGHRLLREPPPP